MSETVEEIIFRNNTLVWVPISGLFFCDVSTSISTRIAYSGYFWWMHTFGSGIFFFTWCALDYFYSWK